MIAASHQRQRVTGRWTLTHASDRGLGQTNPLLQGVPDPPTTSWSPLFGYMLAPFTGAYNAVTTAAADAYSTIKYTDIPVPGYQSMGAGTQPTNVLPAPAAPSTSQQMTTPGAWTPDMAAQQGSQQYGQNLTSAIQAAEKAGTYTPQGTLIGNLLSGDIPNPFSNPTTMLFIAVAGGIVLFMLLKR